MTNLIEVWDQADAIRPDYFNQKTAIEKNPDLTLEARNRQLKELSDKYNGQMQSLKKQWFDGKTTRKEEILKDAFGIGHKQYASEADISAKETNYRNALAVAAKADSADDLQALLEQANLTNDDLLKKAVGFEARKHGVNKVLQQVMPEDDFKELMALDSTGNFAGERFHFSALT